MADMDGNRIVGADRLLIPDFLVNLINGEYFSCIPDEKRGYCIRWESV